MLDSEKIFIAGSTGKICFLIARALAQRNAMWHARARSGPPHTGDASLSSAPAGQTLSYCFLDEDPVAVAEQWRSALEKRWSGDGPVTPLFAARFTPWCRTNGMAMLGERGAS